jgi:hypothetical protein
MSAVIATVSGVCNRPYFCLCSFSDTSGIDMPKISLCGLYIFYKRSLFSIDQHSGLEASESSPKMPSSRCLSIQAGEGTIIPVDNVTFGAPLIPWLSESHICRPVVEV